MDLYYPTKSILKKILPRLFRGSVIVFDEINCDYCPGETQAILESLKFTSLPILSFFSGFKWTDTTQGFRGYSSKVLSDKKIKIFRSIFKTYELLAYLSYIIPKCGYKCIEVPTTREYPLGKNPTKINGFIENFKIFVILLKTCLGKYNVNQEDE